MINTRSDVERAQLLSAVGLKAADRIRDALEQLLDGPPGKSVLTTFNVPYQVDYPIVVYIQVVS